MSDKPSRRAFLEYFASCGLAGSLFPGALWATAAAQGSPPIDRAAIEQAEKLAGLEFTDAERDQMLRDLENLRTQYEEVRQVPLENGDAPAFRFDPLVPGATLPLESAPPRFRDEGDVRRPPRLEDIAFWPVSHLAVLLRTRQVSSLELTDLYLARLERHDPKLHCVVMLLRDRARAQARQVDAEIARGEYRGPLHGIPWGAKDLLAVRGHPTTWGARPFREQVIDFDATVVDKLDRAGAVLVAKLSLGALAWGDVWFGGRTRNPWNPAQGSSGSSAGSASATAAGLVGFAIGSETLGSIVSPSTVCGVTGLRPTFGRVSRHGAMALSWTMDKIGPICRSVEDCALVFDAIRGADGEDADAIDGGFSYDAQRALSSLRVGWFEKAFEKASEHDRATIARLRELGVRLVPVSPPVDGVGALSYILSAEAAAAFDELTRSNRDDELVRQTRHAWPNVLRQARSIPAVEYIQANRVRRRLQRDLAGVFEKVDCYVTPSFAASQLLLTNLTGHPCVVLPNGFDDGKRPHSITFIGDLYRESSLLRVAAAYQDATAFHRQHPVLDAEH